MVWRRFGGGLDLEEVWRRFGEGLEQEGRKQGGGREEVWRIFSGARHTFRDLGGGAVLGPGGGLVFHVFLVETVEKPFTVKKPWKKYSRKTY